jgi:hypothetical protein
MDADFPAVFALLRGILNKHAGALVVSEDLPTRYCLSAPVGPATIRAWGGKKKIATIPVA